MDKLTAQFSKEKLQMANKYMKRCSTFLAIKEMQVKLSLTFHLTSVRKAVIKKTNNSKCMVEYMEWGTLDIVGRSVN
jgi:hypothetical protein